MPRKPIPPPSTQDGKPWETVQSGIKDIIGRKQSGLSLSALHSAVGSLVSSNKVQDLKTGLQNLLRAHFDSWRQELSVSAGNPLLHLLSGFYDDFRMYCSIIPKFYMLFDRHFSSSKGETLSIIRILFKECVLGDAKLIDDTTIGIRKEIGNARSKSDVQLQQVHNILDLYYSYHNEEPKLDIFTKFMKLFDDDSNKYYDEFYKAKFEGNSFPNYLQIVSDQFKHEESILRQILQEEEIRRILIICNDNLLVQHEDLFLEGSEPPISNALTATDPRPMKWLVETYTRFECSLAPIFKSCSMYVSNEMLKLSNNFNDKMKANEITTAIGELISLTNNLSKPYHLIFNEVSDALETLESEIKKAWNDEKFSIVNNFILYIDNHIKSEFKNFTQEEKDHFPDIVAKFFTRIEDKKAFFTVYEAFMVRRIIKMQTKLPEIEVPIISAIRRAKAPDFAKSWDIYVKKINEAQQLESQFREQMALHTDEITNNGKYKQIQFAPIIFDQAKFPLDKIEVKYIPPQIHYTHDLFIRDYTTKHPKTKLMLLSDVSVVESKFHVPKNPKSNTARTYTISSDIVCASIIQSVAENSLTLREINDIVQEERGKVGQYLVRLCGSGSPILKRTSTEGKKLSDDDVFQLNPQFYFNTSRVTIPPIVSERKATIAKTQIQVDLDKAQSIKAAIVRVLKKNIRIAQPQLENEVTQEVANYFRADTALIRRQLVELENEEYCSKEDVAGSAVPIIVYKT